jgi:hypothetical protein
MRLLTHDRIRRLKLPIKHLESLCEHRGLSASKTPQRFHQPALRLVRADVPTPSSNTSIRVQLERPSLTSSQPQEFRLCPPSATRHASPNREAHTRFSPLTMWRTVTHQSLLSSTASGLASSRASMISPSGVAENNASNRSAALEDLLPPSLEASSIAASKSETAAVS